ncbi:MAG: histidine kinase [Actinobacteria bacterium]|nr:histidine kinase [Actinomycetota bacterium]
MSATPLFDRSGNGAASAIVWPPPIGKARFWIIQGLVFLVVIVQELLWLPGIRGWGLGIPPFVAIGLFGIPVLYAALDFGFAASVATATIATGATVVTIVANAIFGHVPALYSWAYAVELASLLVVAAAVGSRFERETRARIEVEHAALAASVAEERYHSLFEASAAPVLLVDRTGVVREANASARRTFSHPSLFGRTLREIIGGDAARILLAGPKQKGTPVHVITPNGIDYMLMASAAPTVAAAADTKAADGKVADTNTADPKATNAKDAGRRSADRTAGISGAGAGDARRPRKRRSTGAADVVGERTSNTTDHTAGDASWPDGILQVVFQDVTEEIQRQRQTEAYAEHVMRAQEEERRRIARELHDEPVQSLVHLCHRIDAAMEVAGLPESAFKELEDTRTMTEGIITELRNIATGLRPPALDDLGLVASLRNLVSEYNSRTDAQVTLRITGTMQRMDQWRELTIYRITQEALSNVERHSEATEVLVSLKTTGNMLRLAVVDNGQGFDSDNRTPSGGAGSMAGGSTEGVSGAGSMSGAGGAGSIHLGLLGMRERAQLAGGSLRVDSRPGKGTLVSLRISYCQQ